MANPDAATVTEAVLSVLEPFGLTGTPRGRSALVLAGRLDNADTESAAGLAALARQLDALMDAAIAAVPISMAPDPIDVLRAKRRRSVAARKGEGKDDEATAS